MIEWTGLEIRRTALPYRGFESHSFRNISNKESPSLLEAFFVGNIAKDARGSVGMRASESPLQ